MKVFFGIARGNDGFIDKIALRAAGDVPAKGRTVRYDGRALTVSL